MYYNEDTEQIRVAMGQWDIETDDVFTQGPELYNSNRIKWAYRLEGKLRKDWGDQKVLSSIARLMYQTNHSVELSTSYSGGPQPL